MRIDRNVMALVAMAVCAGVTVVHPLMLPAGQASAPLSPATVPFSPAVAAGNTVYLAGMLATDASGALVKGDIKVQTRQVLDNLARLLEANGSSLPQVASVTVYLKRAEDFAAMNEVYRTCWPKDPPARTTVIANLVMPDALVEISMIALKNGAERVVIHPDGWSRAANPYSYGIKSGDTLYLAGLVSRDGRTNNPLPGDMTAQTWAVLDNAKQVLNAAGMTFADVVSARVFLTDTTHFQEMNAAYRARFPVDPPARATVRTGLTSPAYLVEITLTAIKGGRRTAIVTPEADGSPGRPNPNLSSAIRVGRRLFLSGMLGLTDANRTDAAGQTQEAMARLGRTLKAAGFDWSDVVDATVYLPRLEDFAAMNNVYRTFFPRAFPARATVEAGLVNPDGLVEIMMTAVRR